MQAHVYDKTQPENLQFLEKIRALLNDYGAIAIGEVGADDSLGVMAEYTADDNKLHMAYSFNLLTPDISAHYIRTQVEEFEARVKGGWVSWSVGNHDVVRVMSRWGGKNPTPQFAKMMLALQLALKGTPCLYQGDELALTEADIAYEDIQDPYGITFWPEFKGRDGCRTPIPWNATALNAGFSSHKPWLPVPPEHAANAVAVQDAKADSALNYARHILRWRKQFPQLMTGNIIFFDAPEPILALRRDLAGHRSIVAAFNLSDQAATFTWHEAIGAAHLAEVGLPGSLSGAQLELPAFGAWFGELG